MVRSQLDVLARRPDVAQVLFTHFARAGRIPDIAASVDAVFYSPVGKLLRDGEADGSLHCDDIEATTAAIFGAVMIPGFHFLLAEGTIPTERVARQLEALIRHGLAREP